ncbi:MAG: hypothetical protein JXQ80_12680 [Bacteroidales bacterium]|nr:hypothetical protein [Bacteroidales bacterium]
MKKLLLPLVFLIVALASAEAQEQTTRPPISRDNLELRPNSRDYTIVRRGNNHQRVVQMRTKALIRHKQAMVNRQVAMEKRRAAMQQQMFRQQNIRQRMIRQRGLHR